jgi:regulator of protease activity HflC (stomatin/prohibitin superfamily)
MTLFDSKRDNHFLWRLCGCSTSTRNLVVISISVLSVIGLLLFIILLAVSIQKVDENQMAIPYGKVSRTVGNPVDPGLRAYSPDTKLFKYDSTFITEDYRLTCLSRDGLVMDLDVVQQYRILKDELRTVFFNFGSQENLALFIKTLAQSVIRNVCSNFRAEEFVSRRGEVELFMINNMTETIENSDSYIQPGFVQLKNIALPARLMNAIQSKQLTFEDIEIARNERAQTITQAETRKQQANLDSQIVIVQAEADANGIRVRGQQLSSGRLAQWNERALAFLIDLEAIGIDPETYVDNYLYPRLTSRTLTPIQQTCLLNCAPNTACWYCFATASPSIQV